MTGAARATPVIPRDPGHRPDPEGALTLRVKNVSAQCVPGWGPRTNRAVAALLLADPDPPPAAQPKLAEIAAELAREAQGA